MIWIILATLVVSILRLFIPSHPLSWNGTYEALAHVYVGVLLTLMLSRRFQPKTRQLAFVCLMLATTVEILAFKGLL